MSAITGIFYRNGRNVNLKQIQKMNKIISHRGPDGSSNWIDGYVAFGHQMLHTTPESLHEKLPFQDKKLGLVITADARIDNRNELSEKLDIEDKEEVSDSYFILKSYEKWGEKCPEHLLGDFAFAIWDENEKKLFCARDHMGVKPFYYYLDDDLFVFGTEIKALLSVPEISVNLNETKVGYHLIPLITDRELTFYEKIFRLPAAQILIINNNIHKKEYYWKLDPDYEIKLDSDEEYYTKFRDLFEIAVKCRLRSNKKIGFELSGGIDSSSVVAMAKKIWNNNVDINTFSLIFEEIKETDESYYIKKVVETGGIKPHYLVADSISPFNEIEDIFFYQDEPYDTPNLAMIWQLYKKMHNNDIKIVLGGHDGDSLLYKGENYLMELFITFRWLKLIQEIQYISNGLNIESFKLFVAKVVFPLIPQLHDLWLKFKGTKKEKDFANINKNFVKRLHLNEKYKELEYKPYRKAKSSKKIHYYYLTLATHQSIFEMMDKFAGALSMEARHPMMDKRLVEFCYGVPTYIKYDNGWGRLLVRRGLSDLLPKEVQWRRGKRNFFHVFERNLVMFEKDNLNKLLFRDENIKNYADINNLEMIYDRFIKKNEGADSIDIWKTAILSLWLNYNIQFRK